jgi:hypothetical protein
MIEEWIDIPSYEGKYQASNQGRIRSLTREITQISRYGTAFTRTVKGRILRPACSKRNPHLYVVLGHGANGSQVHQLIARTFLGQQPPNTDVRHLNGNPQDNRPENLLYGSRTENILDVFRQGKAWRKLTSKQAEEIKTRLSRGEKGCDLAKEFKVTDSIISAIKVGRIHSCNI